MQKKDKIKKSSVFVGLILTCAFALGTLFLSLRFLKDPRADTFSLFNLGMDTLGAFVCAVLFTGCMRQLDFASSSFSMLVVLESASFAVNGLMWVTAGMPALRTAYFWCCILSKWLNLAMIYFFFLYVKRTLDFTGRLAKWAGMVFPILLAASMLIVFLNVFFPLSFSVDAGGVYGSGRFSWLEDVFLIVSSVVTTVLIVRCKASHRQKRAAMSFILIPIVEFIASGGAFAYATQYSAVLISLILMYCILFNERSGKLAATQTELAMATQIQESILPSIFPAFPDRSDFDIYASMDPAKEVGGDFYDYFLIDDDHLCMVIADVSGKGVPAALFMMASKIILQSVAMLGSSPAEILKKTNEALCSNNEADMFVTVWLGILELSTGKLTAANAGHEFPALKQPNGPFELYKDAHDFVLGGFDDSEYGEYTLTLEPGARMFFYTDGVPEAVNAQREQFGTERMLEALNAAPDAGPEELLKNVRAAVNRFVKDAEQFDDLTMLGFEYKIAGA